MQENDRADFLAYYMDPDVAPLLGGHAQTDARSAEVMFHGHCVSPCVWALAQKTTGRVIGDVHLGEIVGMHLAHIGYLLHRDVRGSGLGREAVHAIVRYALEETPIRRIRAVVLTRNQPSIRLLESCGFQREAMLRDGNYGGRVEDIYYYSISKNDLR